MGFSLDYERHLPCIQQNKFNSNWKPHEKKSLKLVILSASLAVAGLSTSALAQDKPAVKIMVGFPPGGSVDVVARLLAEKLRVSLDQNVIVENKPGAAGRIALGELKRANPDGNTLALVPSGGLVIMPWLFKIWATTP